MKWKLTDILPFVFVWLWSTGYVGAKYGLPYIEPFFMLLVRFVAVIFIFYCMIFLLKMRSVNWNQALSQMLIGLLIHGGYLGGVFFAIDRGIPAGIAAIIVGLQPIVTALAAWLMLGHKLNTSQVIGLLIGFSGITLILIENNNFGSSDLSTIGLMACFVALLCISIGTLLQSRYAQKVPLVSGTLFQYIGAMFFVALLTLTTETQQVTYDPALFLSLAWMVIALSAAAILLLMYMIREGEVAKVSSYFYLVTPVAVAQAWWIFDERLGLISILGAALVVYAVYLVNRPKKLVAGGKAVRL